MVKTVTHEEVTSEDLGGAAVHNQKSGAAHFATPDDKSCLLLLRKLLSYLPLNNAEEPPIVATDDPVDREDEALDTIVPSDAQKPYDMREVIERIVDADSWLEVQEGWAQNMLIGFARLGGRPVGIVANQPAVLAGYLTSTPARRPRASSPTATPSTSRSSPSRTSPASSPARPRSTRASSAGARSSSSRTARPRCRC